MISREVSPQSGAAADRGVWDRFRRELGRNTAELAAEAGGIEPHTAICVGEGIGREEVKQLLLEEGVALGTRALASVGDLAEWIVAGLDPEARRADLKKRRLGDPLRRELLRVLFQAVCRTRSADFPELFALRTQRAFLKRLDSALQRGRLAAATAQEAIVLEQLLIEALGPGSNPWRFELRALTAEWEAFLRGLGKWDEPMLLRRAIELLEALPFDSGFVLRSFPSRILRLEGTTADAPLVRLFWERLAERVEVRRPVVMGGPARFSPPDWRRWHTLDDAAEALAERIAADDGEIAVSTTAVLMPDDPSVRRSLSRALEKRNLFPEDPRDPTRLRRDEGLKWALLPLEMVGSGYERSRVVAFLRTLGDEIHPDFGKWQETISRRGIVRGLDHYRGGALSSAHPFLQEMERELGGRLDPEELSERFLEGLRRRIGGDEARAWLEPFFTSVFKTLVDDFRVLERVRRRGMHRGPASFWLDRLRERLDEAKPPAEPTRIRGGLRLYRLDQLPLSGADEVIVFGAPADHLLSGRAGDYWFSERERDVLGPVQEVPCAAQVRRERRERLQAWFEGARRVSFMDGAFNWDGSERPSLLPLLEELGFPVRDEGGSEMAAEEAGAHPSLLSSYSAFRPSAPANGKLADWARKDEETGLLRLSATHLDAHSRCPFLAVARHRWRLEESREPEEELWPDLRGRILHEAFARLVRTRDSEGAFTMTAREALDAAIAEHPWEGMLPVRRFREAQERKLLRVIDTFMDSERQYFERARTRPLILDDRKLTWSDGRVVISAQPDRVDEYTSTVEASRGERGLFVIDYKSSVPRTSGRLILEKGNTLQLPLYALTVAREFRLPVLGLQYVAATPRGERSKGVFLRRYNGKKEGGVTATTAANSSLVDLVPEALLERIEGHVRREVDELVSGAWRSAPKSADECKQCRVRDLCQQPRRTGGADAATVAAGAGGEEGGEEA